MALHSQARNEAGTSFAAHANQGVAAVQRAAKCVEARRLGSVLTSVERSFDPGRAGLVCRRHGLFPVFFRPKKTSYQEAVRAV